MSENKAFASPLEVIETFTAPVTNIPDGVRLIGAPLEWPETEGASVRVAVLDTGSPRHPDLKVAGEVDFTGSPHGAVDVQGHGTHCAGIICADGRIKGVAPKADLFGVKVLNDHGQGDFGWIAQGIRWCVRERMDVISLSLGGSRPPNDDLLHALQEAHRAGIVIVAASGNAGEWSHIGGPSTVLFPAAYAECIATAAVDVNRRHAPFSSHGYEVDIASFGVDVYSTHLGGRYARLSGTSMACPHITGAAALMIAKSRLRKLPQGNHYVRYALELYTDDIPPYGRDTQHGFGVFSFGRLDGENVQQEPFEARLTIGERNFTKNGQPGQLRIAPQLVQARAMLGLRDVADIFDCKVNWVPPRTVVISK